MLKNIHKILKIITGITLFIFIAIIAFKAIIYNITFPYKLHFNINREQFKEFSYQIKTQENINVIYSNKNSKDLILYMLGNMGRLQYILDYFKDHNISFISPAYPGYQGSSGKPSVQNIYETSSSILAEIEKLFGTNINIHVIGHSLGSQAAFYLAHKYAPKIKTISIIAGFDSIKNLCKDTLKLLGLICELEDNNFNNLKLSQKKLDTIFYSFHKKDDKIISYKRGKNLFNNVKANEKYFIELTNGDHAFFDLDYVTNIILNKAPANKK